MKRLKIYLSAVLMICIVSSLAMPSFAAVYSEYELTWLDVPGISGEIYGVSPYGFIVNSYTDNADGSSKTYTALVTDKGYTVPPSEEIFTYVTNLGIIDYGVMGADGYYIDGVKDFNNNNIIPTGKYNWVSTVGENRYLAAQKTQTRVEWSDEKWGIVDAAGDEIIPFGKYAWLECNGLIEASDNDGNIDILDLNGNVLFTGSEALKVRIMGVTDRYIYRDEAANLSYIRRIDGSTIATLNGIAAYHPYNSIDVDEYDSKTKTLTVYVYDFDGNLVNTEIYEDFEGKPYTYYDINGLKADYRIEDNCVVDKNGVVKYSYPQGDVLSLYNDKIVKIADSAWDSMGLADISGNVIVPVGTYDMISYCETYDVYAFVKDGQIKLARLTPVKVIVGGREIQFDQNPVIKEGRTLVPVRKILESLGATVDWDGDTQTVTAKLLGVEIKLTIGSNKMYVAGNEIIIDVPAEILNGRTLVPVRAISEAFLFNVDWDAQTRTINITK